MRKRLESKLEKDEKEMAEEPRKLDEEERRTMERERLARQSAESKRMGQLEDFELEKKARKLLLWRKTYRLNADHE